MNSWAVFSFGEPDSEPAVYLFDTEADAEAMLLDNINPALYVGDEALRFDVYVSKDRHEVEMTVFNDNDGTTLDYTRMRVARVFE